MKRLTEPRVQKIIVFDDTHRPLKPGEVLPVHETTWHPAFCRFMGHPTCLWKIGRDAYTCPCQRHEITGFEADRMQGTLRAGWIRLMRRLFDRYDISRRP